MSMRQQPNDTINQNLKSYYYHIITKPMLIFKKKGT